MTRAHRQRHRRIWFVLAVLLPLVLVVGLIARRAVPVMRGTGFPLAPHPSPLTPP
jgi:hypothetical protein